MYNYYEKIQRIEREEQSIEIAGGEYNSMADFLTKMVFIAGLKTIPLAIVLWLVSWGSVKNAYSSVLDRRVPKRELILKLEKIGLVIEILITYINTFAK